MQDKRVALYFEEWWRIVRIDNDKEGGNEYTDIGPVELTEPTNFTELFYRLWAFHGGFQEQT